MAVSRGLSCGDEVWRQVDGLVDLVVSTVRRSTVTHHKFLLLAVTCNNLNSFVEDAVDHSHTSTQA